MNDNDVDLDLSDLEEPLREKLRAAEENEARLQSEYTAAQIEWRERLAAAGETRRRLEKTLNLLTTGTAVGAKTKAAKERPASEASQDRVFAALQTFPGEDATVPELQRAGLQMSTTTVKSALQALREAEPPKVRLAGKRQSAHDNRPHGAKAQTWAVMENGNG